MDMPTPCPSCGDVEEFDNMRFVDGELCCEECYLHSHICDWCGDCVSDIRYYVNVVIEDNIYGEMELCEECGLHEAQ